jgi:tRNA modification GTPase
VTSSSETPTHVARLTPAGTAAIATLALQGPRAWQVASRLFRPLSPKIPWPPTDAEPGQFWLGRFGEHPESPAADEVVLALRHVVPQPRVEVHCHGGAEVVRWLLETLEAEGVWVCSWQELDGLTTADPIQAAALAALVEAPTVRTAAILLDQYHGALRRALEAVGAARQGHDPDEARRLLDQSRRYAAVGRHLTTPWRVAVLGAPNVGKSSLVNALAGYQRSVVAATPGTTRDVVTTLLAVDGWPVELADTAGMRDEGDVLEREGIDRARRTARTADLRLWVLDASEPAVWPDPSLGALRCVINKIDLSPVWELDVAQGAVRVSARTRAGMDDLCRALAGWLVPDPPPPGAAVPFTEMDIAVDWQPPPPASVPPR